MKNRLNLTVEDSLVEQAKRYAAKHDTSLSQLVEQYFKCLSRSTPKKNIIQMIEELPKPDFDVNTNLKESYYEEQKKRYGF